ncbi:MAG: 1,4-dihydroxy-6-naphthoate synthase [Bacteroidales bacterium]
MNLTLAFSPCPNDTFAFHAMINSLVDTEGLTFTVEMSDVEELNTRAAQGRYDICKLSYHAFFTIVSQYIMLRSGSALGFNNGPLLVKKIGHPNTSQLPDNKQKQPFASPLQPNILPDNPLIAIPGRHTTAALLLKAAYPQYTNLKPILFSDIEKAVLCNEVDAGVLIHEGRFTYKEKGLELITDLGAFWQNTFRHPIPLGGIAIKRELLHYKENPNNNEGDLAQKINRVLRRSIEYACAHPLASEEFIMQNAQEITRQVQQQHINLFVNNFTINIGTEGEKAVHFIYRKYFNTGKNLKLFIEE